MQKAKVWGDFRFANRLLKQVDGRKLGEFTVQPIMNTEQSPAGLSLRPAACLGPHGLGGLTAPKRGSFKL